MILVLETNFSIGIEGRWIKARASRLFSLIYPFCVNTGSSISER